MKFKHWSNKINNDWILFVSLLKSHKLIKFDSGREI